jgi:hypothetical protein
LHPPKIAKVEEEENEGREDEAREGENGEDKGEKQVEFISRKIGKHNFSIFGWRAVLQRVSCFCFHFNDIFKVAPYPYTIFRFILLFSVYVKLPWHDLEKISVVFTRRQTPPPRFATPRGPRKSWASG